MGAFNYPVQIIGVFWYPISDADIPQDILEFFWKSLLRIF